MKTLTINGGKRLNGEIAISGAKNSSMKIIIASILSTEPVLIHNVPYVSDVVTLLQIMRYLGTKITIDGNHTINPSKTIELHSPKIGSEMLDFTMTNRIRTSILMLGPILAKNGYVKLAKPGGCGIGDRKIDLHIMVMKRLGATVIETENFIEATTNGKQLKGTDITFPLVSVGATENAIMASVMADGETILRNVAIEPEIDDLILFLNKLGAQITKIGERELFICGVQHLGATEHSVIPDRIEAATYAVAASMTDGNMILHHCSIKVFDNMIGILSNVGVDIKPFVSKDHIEGVVVMRSNKGFNPIEIQTNPYPHFPTDLQPVLMALLAITKGTSIITENIFEDRMQHVSEFNRLGANIELQGRSAIIRGVDGLCAGTVNGTDLRASAALALCGLVANGIVTLQNAYYIDRGYQNFVRNLVRCGADVVIS